MLDIAPDALITAPASWRTRALRALFTHRLLHFVVLGAVTWAMVPRQATPHIVELDENQVKAIWAAELRKHPSSPLTEQDKQEALSQFIEDELFLREGLRMDLDKDDRIVRNRVVQKVMFYAEDLAGASAPTTDENLRAYFDKTRERWVRDVEVQLQQVFVSNVDHAKDGGAVAVALRAKLIANPDLDPSTLGTAYSRMRARPGEWARPDDIQSDFGDAVAKTVEQLSVNAWSDPIVSARGWHVLRVTDKRSGRQATFEEVKQTLVVEYQLDRKRAAMADLGKRLSKEYTIKVHLPAGETVKITDNGTGRVAVRGGD